MHPFDCATVAVSRKVKPKPLQFGSCSNAQLKVLNRSAIVVLSNFSAAFLCWYFNFCWYRSFYHRTESNLFPFLFKRNVFRLIWDIDFNVVKPHFSSNVPHSTFMPSIKSQLLVACFCRLITQLLW